MSVEGGASITATGRGAVSAAPDLARLVAAVMTSAATAAEALAANRTAMTHVILELKTLGVVDENIRTIHFNLGPQYAPPLTEPRTIKGYTADSSLQVTVDDIGKVGTVLDALVAAGANRIGQVEFAIRNSAPLLAEARAAAVKDALARARTYADAADVRLGAIQSIRDGEQETANFRGRSGARKSDATPISPGHHRISARVIVSVAIE